MQTLTSNFISADFGYISDHNMYICTL